MKVFITTEMLQQYVQVANSFDIDVLLPQETNALEVFLPKWFTQEVIDIILTGSGEVEGSVLNTMYKRLLAVLANEMMFNYSNIAEVQISDLGINRQENENAKAAYSGQMKALREAFKNGRSENLSSLISLIETPHEDIIPTAQIILCPFYRKRQNLLIRKSEEFNDIFPLQFPALTFFELLPLIHDAQALKIKPRIGADVLNSLNPGSLSLDLTYVLRAIVFFTVADALVSGLAKISPSGTLTIDEVDESSENSRQTAKTHQASPVYHQYIAKANQYLDEFYKQLVEAGTIVPNSSQKNRFIA